MDDLDASHLIDDHAVGLYKKEAKFFMLSVNPSHYEILHLVNQYRAEHKMPLISLRAPKEWLSIKNLTEGKKYVIDSIESKLIPKVMDNYAKAYHMPGLESHTQLVYVYKTEFSRKYEHNDKAVLSGGGDGQEKEGFNLHVHVVVSRRDEIKCYKLSPGIRNKNDEFIQVGKNKTRGFALMEFKTKSIADFNSPFHYQFEDDFFKKHKKKYILDKTAKSVIDKGTYRIASKAKNKLISNIEQGHFSTERQLYNKVQNTMTWGKTVVNLATNPAASAKELAVRAIKALLDKSVGKEL
jgi:hypothetical protein